MIAMGSVLLFDGVELSLQFCNCKQSSCQLLKFRLVHGRFRESSESEITFAPVVAKAEPRLHHRTAPQSLERGLTWILLVGL